MKPIGCRKCPVLLSPVPITINHTEPRKLKVHHELPPTLNVLAIGFQKLHPANATRVNLSRVGRILRGQTSRCMSMLFKKIRLN